MNDLTMCISFISCEFEVFMKGPRLANQDEKANEAETRGRGLRGGKKRRHGQRHRQATESYRCEWLYSSLMYLL